MNLKDKPSYANWVKMTSGLITKEEKEILNEKGKKEVKNFSEILGLIDSKNKKVRDSAAYALNEIFLEHLDISENEINSVLENKKIKISALKFSSGAMEKLKSEKISFNTIEEEIKSNPEANGVKILRK